MKWRMNRERGGKKRARLKTEICNMASLERKEMRKEIGSEGLKRDRTSNTT